MKSKDERRFKRYRKTREFSIIFKNKVVKAKMLDYSPDGIGVLIEGAAFISKGDIIDLSIQGPEITTGGEVAWSYIDAAGLRMGIKNKGRLKGLLADFRISDILIGLHRDKKTGILKIVHGNVVKWVYLRDGDMIFSASNQREDSLGDVLLREGRITREEYENTIQEMKKTGLKQSVVLVRLAYIKPQELAIVIRHLVEEIIFSLFNLEDGRFEFEEADLPPNKGISLEMPPANLIYHGIKRMKRDHYMTDEFPELNTVPYFSSDPADLFWGIKLDDAGSSLVSLIDGKRTTDEVIESSLIERSQAVRTLYALMCSGLIDIRTSSVIVENADAIPENIEEEINKEETGKENVRASLDQIQDMHDSYGALGYYGVLGINEKASFGEIRSSYYRAAKRFHPDIHFHIVDEAAKSKLSDIFSYIYEAYATLSSPDKRREYDEKRGRKSSRAVTSKDHAAEKFREGKLKFRKGNFEEAEQLFGQAAYIDNSVADYHYYYGLALMQQNRPKPAGKAIEMALSIDPLNVDFNTDLGLIFMNMGFPKRAMGLFEKALKESPSNKRASEGLLKIQESVS
jgi:tetratricopeptide (TPR) repeat protein